MLNIRNFRNFSGDDGFIIVDGIEDSTLGGKKRLSDIMVPTATSADAGMVLTVGEEGNAEWQEFIEKEIPSASPADEGKVLTIDSAGKPEWNDNPEITTAVKWGGSISLQKDGTQIGVILSGNFDTDFDSTHGSNTIKLIGEDASNGTIGTLALSPTERNNVKNMCLYHNTTAGQENWYFVPSPITNGVLTNTNGAVEWNDIPKDTFIAEYNVTTYAEIKAAYDAGKQIICKDSSSMNSLYYNLVEFFGMSGYESFTFAQSYNRQYIKSCTCSFANGWSKKEGRLQIELTANNGLNLTNNVIGIDTTSAETGDVLTFSGDNIVWAPAQGGSSYTAGTDIVIDNNTIKINTNGTANSADMSFVAGSGTYASGIGAAAFGVNTSAVGNASHAEGANTVANASYSHAEGQNTFANGTFSHAEGMVTYVAAAGNAGHAEGGWTSANAFAAHAEGEKTVAIGGDSHAEGYGTSAKGEQSHAEGKYTIASHLQAHSEGYYTIASGDYAHAEGKETSAVGSATHSQGSYTIASGDSTFAAGQYNTFENASALFVLGNGSADNARTDAFIIYPDASISSTSVKTVIGPNNSAVGDEYVIIGNNNTASGDTKIILGKNNYILDDGDFYCGSGISSTITYTASESKNHNVYFGNNSTLCDAWSVFGYGKNTISSDAEYEYNYANTVFGQNNQVLNSDYDFIQGEDNSAYNTRNTTAIGYANTLNDTSDSMIIGYANEIKKINSTSNLWMDYIFGCSNSAMDTDVSILAGYGNKITSGNSCSFAVGCSNSVSGIAAYAIGHYNKVNLKSQIAGAWDDDLINGGGGIAIGFKNEVKDDGNNLLWGGEFACGYKTSAINRGSHSEGYSTIASAGGHAEGYGTSAIGSYTHAAGEETIAAGEAMTVVGKFNKTSADALFVVGNGSANTTGDRSDAFIVTTAGNASIAGTLVVSGMDILSAIGTIQTELANI